jgi:hypothetical protein
MGEVSRRLNARRSDIDAAARSGRAAGALIGRIADNTHHVQQRRAQVLDALWAGPAKRLPRAGGRSHRGQGPQADERQRRAGKNCRRGALPPTRKMWPSSAPATTKALNALVGQIMKGSKGKANPQQVNDLLRKKLPDTASNPPVSQSRRPARPSWRARTAPRCGHILSVLGGLFLAVQRNRHRMGCGTGRLDDGNGLPRGRARRHHIVHDQHPPLSGAPTRVPPSPWSLASLRL